ncbi:hypothetical protein [Streptomyces sp. NPDC058595]|uniref:hypothetical protein n=1 Tax=Streptomyces sp. NPDC058595 TaxID=3346550 RepID=UPI00364A8FF6
MSRPRLYVAPHGVGLDVPVSAVSSPDGALGPVWDHEEPARLDPADTDQLQQLLTSLRAWALQDGCLPTSDAMRRTVALVLDGRHAPADVPDLDVLIDTFSRYLAYLVEELRSMPAELPSGATSVAELATRASALLAEDRLPGNRRRDVVRLAGAVRDLMVTVETVSRVPGTGA